MDWEGGLTASCERVDSCSFVSLNYMAAVKKIHNCSVLHTPSLIDPGPHSASPSNVR